MFWGLAFNVGAYPQLVGWVLCDGMNGTHDMRNRMSRGVPAVGAVGAIGGSANHNHAAGGAVAPVAHCHPGTTIGNRQHDHPGTTTTCCDHDHAGSVADVTAWDHTHGHTSEANSHISCRVCCEDNQARDYLGICIDGCCHKHWVGHSGPGGLHCHCLTLATDCHKHIPTIALDVHNHWGVMDLADDEHQHSVVGNVDARVNLWPLYRDLYLVMKL